MSESADFDIPADTVGDVSSSSDDTTAKGAGADCCATGETLRCTAGGDKTLSSASSSEDESAVLDIPPVAPKAL